MSAPLSTSIISGRGRCRLITGTEPPEIPTGFPCHTPWDSTMGGAS
jgi:hypothetical protein